MRQRRLMVGAAAAAALIAPVALASAAHGPHHRAPAPFGTVVDWRAASHTATIARPSGQLFAIHSRIRIVVGTRVAVRHLTRLKNGTYSGTLVREGRTRRLRVRGVVVANLGPRGFAVGAAGTTFVVHVGHREAAAGNPLVYVQMKAGHSQSQITERYIHAAQVLFPGAAAKGEARMFALTETEIRMPDAPGSRMERVD